jgi:hypothetical protein
MSKGVAAEKRMILAHGDDTSGLRRPLFLAGFLY